MLKNVKNDGRVLLCNNYDIHLHHQITQKTIKMKAIINTKSASYKHLNGKTFNVKEVFSSFVAIEIPSQICEGRFDTCDFNHNEVLIVDIDAEIQKAFHDQNWGNDHERYLNLKNYCIIKKIKIKVVLNTFA
jgi:hypothetical protein